MGQIKKYTIEINYISGDFTEVIDIKTNKINWSMDEFQRNRMPFRWKIVKEEEL